MTCIKTGADVLLTEHAATIHGDLFQVGDTYILAVGNPLHNPRVWDHRPTRYNIRASAYTQCGSHCIAFKGEHSSEFFYEARGLV